MEIKLTILPHQTKCIESIASVFDSVNMAESDESSANPIFSKDDITLKNNIEKIQSGLYESVIPVESRTSIENEFGVDVKMETGTGKTYCYTRLMYELNKLYGFFKFIILVPTTPIKEGTLNFIQSNYAMQHFSDLYPGRRIELSVLNAQKSNKGRKMFPQAVANFARSTVLEKNKISALLMTSGMLISKTTMDTDYDQTLLGHYSKPYDTLKATRPIVIIDEPHKFKRENTAYKRLIERIDPLCIIRFGATFPQKKGQQERDYNNLIFNLGACEAFNSNLVKGVETQLIEQESLNETRVKVLDIKHTNPKSCVIRNEKSGKSYTLALNDSLSTVSDDFHGVIIQSIGKTEEETIKKGITLSNGQILAKGDQIYAGVYSNTYQELMLKQAIQNHIEQERCNFLRETKIKTLSLFFIDSIESYRGEDGFGSLRCKFQELLKVALEEEYNKFKNSKNIIELDYSSFLLASLSNIEQTNGGYFAEDNSTSDVDIQKEIDQILRDKQSLLNFKDSSGQWNIRRFIFSKWTLREGWDNPNVFQICKLRSSGSEISKLQEVGRGLRLPVDEYGNRLSDEQFYLTYLCDYSEKGFAESLVNEINQDLLQKSTSIMELLLKVATDNGVTPDLLMGQLLTKGYINYKGDIIEDKREALLEEYPGFNSGLQQGKVRNKNKKTKDMVNVRTNKFAEIKELWKCLNEKYYLVLDDISDDELYKAVLSILKSDIKEDMYAYTIRKSMIVDGSKAYVCDENPKSQKIEEKLPYGEFLKRVQQSTGLSTTIMHKALCSYNMTVLLDDAFFNKKTLERFIRCFHIWFENTFVKRFSYKSLGVKKRETSLTDINGEVKGEIVQGVIGINKDTKMKVPDNFLYDQVVFDSPKEKENIQNSEINEVVVFGKIPRKSIQVPLYFGGTTSPDFMYVVKKGTGHEVNLIVETKDVDRSTTLRGIESLKIESAKKFFETLKNTGVNVVFKEQLKNDEIVPMIKALNSDL